LGKSLFADFILLFVTLIWGATFVMVKNAVSLLPPFTFNAVRFLLASVVLGLILWIMNRSVWRSFNRDLMKAGIKIGIWLFAGYAFQTFGLMYTTSSKAGFITGLSVVLVPLFSFWLLRQKIRKQTIAGVCIATVGLSLISFNKAESVNWGDLLVLLCAFSFAMHIVTVSRYASKFSAFLLGFVQISTVGIFSAMAALIFEKWRIAFDRDILMSPQVLHALVVTSVFATAFAFVAQSQFQKFTTATRTALIFSMEPVFAAVTAYLWADEILSPQAILGSLCILTGMILAELGGDDSGRSTHATEHETVSGAR
jgi:drug/metabolite transporter (DMT)-like permease